ncbi:hypothetical protein SPRG_04220 [Saprolegnia parasitica CBS 223.65]|uniref:Elicitin n=1 Tax=Saprolegnia parasitica (strain CBS 223.65) TaxID=695850 RepID=A0A067CKH2_SAPPC|nr:hypothetical protein SPRG_04220 [Saprolegnia parasitica CBS 223.65]KDO31033.1 hypothetical protein SPRG_04220 [Saprolegnia parasitica CBS 223.65]|eukprot:XP_012198210.1 hypothetical protein SPRG_04220 [Saprolegnia parasitica CBS 223.65]
MDRRSLLCISLACAVGYVAGDACSSTILVPVLLPVLGKPNYANCQKDSGVPLSLTGNLPSPANLALVGATKSCVAFYDDVQAAVNSAGVTCTVNGQSVSSFLGTSITTFLTNLNAYMSSTTAPPAGAKPLDNSASLAALAYLVIALVITTHLVL